MRGHWCYWKGQWGADWCQQVIEAALDIPVMKAEVGFYSNDTTRRDDATRVSNIRWLNRDYKLWNDIAGEIDYYFHEANREYYGFDVWKVRDVQFTEYEVGAHYNWHTDIDWSCVMAHHRKISMTIQLSSPEDYTGGDFILDPHSDAKPDPVEIKEQGTILTFPSFVRHKVEPVTSGKRYCLVCWIEGPCFK